MSFADVDRPKIELSLRQGGPLYTFLQRAGYVAPNRLGIGRVSLAAVAVTWMPMMAFAGVQWVATGRLDPFLFDASLHARLLIAIPLLFAAEALLDDRCADAVGQFVGGPYSLETTAVHRLLVAVERFRDAPQPEALLAAVALARGLEAAWIAAARSPAEIWYEIVALPVFVFLFLRWLFRWALWSSLLFGFSRLELKPAPTHPDRAGGLSHLAEPTTAFGAFVFTCSCVIAARWGQDIVRTGATVPSFGPAFVGLVALALAIGLGPLLFFSRCLWHARIEGLKQYRELALRYSRSFHYRWVVEGVDSAILGSPDMQSLADLQSVYRELERMRFVPFGPRETIVIVAAAVIPMLPLVAIAVPVPELFQKIMRAVLGDFAP